MREDEKSIQGIMLPLNGERELEVTKTVCDFGFKRTYIPQKSTALCISSQCQNDHTYR